MAKRFTDSRKFEDPWYRELNPTQKCLWEYFLSTCDHAGIFKFDPNLASFVIGDKVSISDIEKNFSDRIIKLKGDKFFIPKFLVFQYPTGLNSNKPAIVSVRKVLKANNLEKSVRERYGNDYLMVNEPLDNDSIIVKDKDKDKDKDNNLHKDDEKFDYSKLKETWNKFDSLPNIRSISEKRKESIRARIKEIPNFDDWGMAIERITQSKFLMGENKNGWRADFDWFIQRDSILKLLEGKYDKSLNSEKERESSKDEFFAMFEDSSDV